MHEPDMISSGDAYGAGIGVVFCSPFAEEKLWSHRVFVNMARMLADNGYTVLRFDQRGHGDSEGNDEDITVETYCSDIIRAIHLLGERSGLRKVGALGLRWGSTMAVLASRDALADFLILWEPIIKAENYIQQCLRSNLATQLLLHRKVLKTREQLVGDLKKGLPVNIDGYLMSPELYSQAVQINLFDNPGAISVPVLLVRINKGRVTRPSQDHEDLYRLYLSSNPLSAYKEIQEEPFWAELKSYFQRSETLFSETLSWMDNTLGR